MVKQVSQQAAERLASEYGYTLDQIKYNGPLVLESGNIALGMDKQGNWLISSVNPQNAPESSFLY